MCIEIKVLLFIFLYISCLLCIFAISHGKRPNLASIMLFIIAHPFLNGVNSES